MTKGNKVIRKGTFDGFVGTITQMNYITEELVLVQFPGGEGVADLGDLILYTGQERGSYNQ